MKKILCPIDFSEVSLNALEFAVSIGEKQKSDITLLNIFTPADFNKILKTDDISVKYEQLLEMAEQKLQAIQKEIINISQHRGLASCDYLLKSGKVVDVLRDISKEQDYELIVTGTTGHSRYDRKYLGGKAEEIIEETPVSVLCVPEAINFHGINKIVYATDYQEEDKLAIQQLIKLVNVLDAQLTILHVSHHDDTIDKTVYEEFVKELKKFTKDFSPTFDRLVFKHVASGIDEYMKQNEADLLVLLKKKKNFLTSLFQTSLTQHLGKFTDYPLMVVKV